MQSHTSLSFFSPLLSNNVARGADSGRELTSIAVLRWSNQHPHHTRVVHAYPTAPRFTFSSAGVVPPTLPAYERTSQGRSCLVSRLTG
jgi:hypothetical protein